MSLDWFYSILNLLNPNEKSKYVVISQNRKLNYANYKIQNINRALAWYLGKLIQQSVNHEVSSSKNA